MKLINGMKMIGDTWHYYLNGEEVTKKEYEKVFPPNKISDREAYAIRAGGDWAKPIHSDALAVHPDDRDKAIREAQERGVPTDFDSEGRPLLRSRKHRKDYMTAFGFFDRSGGYGDAQFTGRKVEEPKMWDPRK